MPVTVEVRLDKKALDKELNSRGGAVDRTLAAFGGIVTREIKDVFTSRAGGPWWRVSSTSIQGSSGGRGTRIRTTIQRSRPHRIVARNAPALFFTFPDGSQFTGTAVNHPGSTPPENLILLGIERAGRRVTFTRAAPRVSGN